MPLMALASLLDAAPDSVFELCSVKRRGAEKMPTTSGDERAYSSPLAASPFSTATFLRTRVRKPSGPLVKVRLCRCLCRGRLAKATVASLKTTEPK